MICGIVGWLMFSAALFAQQADMLVVGNPAALVIYNKYEQEITEAEQAVFLPYKPMEILDADAFLSDGFVSCIKIQMNRQLFFILKGEDGRPLKRSDLKYYQRFKNARLLQDTVEIVRGDRIFMSLNPNRIETKPEYILAKGVLLRRVCRYRGKTWVEILPGTQQGGWSLLKKQEKNRSWKVYRRAGSDADEALPPYMVRQVEHKISEINMLFQKMFRFFNRKTRQQKKIPFWHLEIQKNRIICSLRNQPEEHKFSETRHYLKNSLGYIILDASLEIVEDGENIEIRRKNT